MHKNSRDIYKNTCFVCLYVVLRPIQEYFTHMGTSPYAGLFFCLFDIVLRPTQEYFTHMETSPYAGEGLLILAYDRHLRPLSSDGSLTCRHIQ